MAGKFLIIEKSRKKSLSEASKVEWFGEKEDQGR